MPTIPERIIVRAWRHRDETEKIHYVVKRPDKTERHLVAKPDSPLYEILEAHLLAIGYTGPAEESES